MSQCDRILHVLADGNPHSHHEFYGWCVLHSRISELRRRGHRITVRRQGDLYLYQLDPGPVLSEPPSPAQPSRTEGASTFDDDRPHGRGGGSENTNRQLELVGA